MRARLYVGALFLVLGAVYALRGGYVPASYLPLGAEALERSGVVPVVTDWRIAALRTDRTACHLFFSGTDVRAVPADDQPVRNGCGWQNGIRLEAVGPTKLKPVTMSCPAAASTAKWIRHVVQPASKKHLNADVTKLLHFGSYSCRNIRGPGGGSSHQRSEHATANALDVSGFALSDGSRVTVLDDWNGDAKKSAFLREVHLGACRYFRVVLGPNANALHQNHFHFDRGWLFSCR